MKIHCSLCGAIITDSLLEHWKINHGGQIENNFDNSNISSSDIDNLGDVSVK